MATREPAGSHTEIERVFLLDGPPELPAHAEAFRIEQGYFAAAAGDADAGTDATVVAEGRVRRRTGPRGDVVCTHTVKRGLGIARHEEERTISGAEFEDAWTRTEGRRLRKTRHRVAVPADPASGATLVWEIDVFDDFDLVLAEVELPAEDTLVRLPWWLASRVVREVTEEPHFRNFALAMNRGVVSR